jgi:hypothetical protein
LEQLVKQSCRYDVNEAGELTRLEIDPAYRALSVADIEEDLAAAYPKEAIERLSALREHRTCKELQEALALFVDRSIADQAGEQLVRAEWRVIIGFVREQTLRFGKRISRALVRERMGVGTEVGSQFETSIEHVEPGFLERAVAEYYAEELKDLFPGMIRRAESLRVLPASQAAPPEADGYLLEASRCFVYGHLLAALFLCRSALEAALQERLKGRGYGDHLIKVQASKLKAMLELAHEDGLLDDVLFAQATTIRKASNAAIHGHGIPRDLDCRDYYVQTRGIIQHLYA